MQSNMIISRMLKKYLENSRNEIIFYNVVEERITTAKLSAMINTIMAKIKFIKPREYVIIQVGEKKTFIASLIALFFLDAIPIILPLCTSSSGYEQLKKILKKHPEIIIIADNQGYKNIGALSEESAYIHNIENDILTDCRKRRAYGKIDEAIVMFSSGSITEPKGAIITVNNIIESIKNKVNEYNVTQNDVFMTWISLEHILGFIDFMFVPFFANCKCVYSEISSFLANPKEWFDLIEKYRATVSCAPNFAYKYMCDCISSADSWNLSSIRILMSGGEPISRNVMNDFFYQVKKYHLDDKKFVAAYGLSETCSGVVINKGKVLQTSRVAEISLELGIDFDKKYLEHIRDELICQGEPMADTKVRIVDDDFKELGKNCVGNIEIKGGTVFKGYYGYNGRIPVREGWLSTGDIGFFSSDGLYVLGRRSNVLFSYGRNIYLSDIEHTVAKCFRLRNVAYGENVPKEGKYKIYLFIEGEEAIDKNFKSEIKHTVLKELGIKLDDITFVKKLSNMQTGKISKNEIMRDYTMNRDAHRKNNITLFMNSYFDNKVAENANLLDVVEDSLGMFRLIGALHQEYGVKLGIADLISNKTIHDLCNYIYEALAKIGTMDNVKNKKDVSCTSMQTAYMLGRQQEFYGNTNMSHFYLEIRHKLCPQKMEETIRKLIRRHSMLRSIFENGRRVVLEDNIAESFHLKTGQEKSLEDYRKEANKKIINPQKWPLFEVHNIQDGDSFIAIIDIDMLIIDGYSLSILFRDFKNLYNENPLQPLGDWFDEYLNWYSTKKRDDKYLRDKLFWLEKAQTLPSSPQLPLLSSVNRSTNVFLRKQKVFTNNFWKKLECFAEKQGVTVSVLLLTLYIYTLKRWSEDPEFTINVTVMDRPTQFHASELLAGEFTTNVLFNYENSSSKIRTFSQDLSFVKNRLYTYLDHNNFDGVEVIREYAKIHQGEQTYMPVVFTSMLFKEDNAIKYNDINYFVTQTSQVYLDCQIYCYDTKYVIAWDYLEKIFPHNMINDMFSYYMNIIEATIVDCDVNDIPIGNENTISNYNQTEFSQILPTVPEMLDKSFNLYSKKIAITDGVSVLTYEQLNKAVQNLVEKFIKQGVHSKDSIIVIVGKNIESVIAILAVAKMGGVFIPIPDDYPDERIETICNSSCAMWVVYALQKHIKKRTAIKITNNTTGTSKITLNDVAYIIFTSGSTGKPKGVVISQEGVMNTLADMKRRFALSEDEGILGLSALNFDLSIFDIFGSIYMGGFLALIKEPRNSKDICYILEHFPITIWNSVPALMKLFLEGIPENYVNEDIRHIFLSGDWIGTQLPQKIKKIFTNAEIISLGGATEASIWSIYFSINEIQESWSSIPYGYPLGNQTIYILNKEEKVCPTGVVGEICIGGKGVALGYIGDDDKTKKNFVSIPKIGKVYKTGDFGKFDAEGFVIILGRKDGQIKINGFRIELGEIESIARSMQGVDNAIAIMNDKEKIVLFYKGKKLDAQQLNAHLGKFLPGYMQPHKLIHIKQFPLNINQKIDRAELLKISNLRTETKSGTPASSIEKTIAHVWEKYLSIENVKNNENFFALGGDSIIAQRIAKKLSDILEIKIPFVKIVETGNIKELAEYVKNVKADVESSEHLTKENQDTDTCAAYQTEIPMTNIQKAYFSGRNASFELARYNAHYYFEVEFPYESNNLNKSIAQLIERHEVLRSVFSKNGTQQILSTVPKYVVNITRTKNREEFTKKNKQIRQALSHKNYDLSMWPLFTFEVLHRESDDYKILCVSINLMVCDGDSLRILLKELAEGIKGNELPPINYTYHEYVKALENSIDESEYKEAKNYWMQKIPYFPEFPHLPMLIGLNRCKDYKISRISETINAKTLLAFKNVVKKHSVSPAAVLCTIYAMVLAKWSNQKDLLLNLTSFERKEHVENAGGIIGDFTKIIPLEVSLDSMNIWDNALQMQKEIFENLEYQAFDGTEIIREISRKNSIIGKAIMPVVFTCVMFNSEENWFEQIGKLKYAVTQTPQVFLDNQIIEMGEELHISWDYVDKLFSHGVITSIFNDFMNGIRNVASTGLFDTASLPETGDLWDRYNIPIKNIVPCTLQELFEKQVSKTPNEVAIYYRNTNLTYAEIEAKANQVARYLCSKGICGADTRVGVLGKRQPETIISILGVLKTGAAYVPIDPNFPKERQKFLLENSETKILLTDELYQSGELENFSESPMGIKALPDTLAYVIYTSGSTGKPKGVMINHVSVCNTINDLNEKIKLNGKDRIIGISSVCFDLSVYDIFGALSVGAALVMISDARDSNEIISALIDKHITVWNSVPVICSIVAQNILKRGMPYNFPLRQILLSGDWIPLDLPNKAKSIFHKAEFMSLGGATEASIWSIYYDVKEMNADWKSIPYGIPMKNQAMYVLNFNLELCPVDVVGEIYIGGVGVAQGYCRDIEKTNCSFIEHSLWGRIYKTGDMGALRKDGYIEFLGRIDTQVKIRGHRIELEEIEYAINNISGIEKSVVSHIINNNGNKQLIAYYIPGDKDVGSEFIKASISKFLPDYMVPQYYMLIKELPLSVNGKIDRSKLPKPKMENTVRALSNNTISPLQEKLLKIWKTVFNNQSISITDNFYNIGGDSIALMKLLDEISLAELPNIGLEEILAHETIEDLSVYLEQNKEHF